jgi:hypothetical protein
LPGMACSIVNVSEIEGSGPGGAVKFVRRELGVEAFGINWFELRPGGAGTFIRFDPETTRCPVAGPDGLTFVAVGCARGSYEPRGPF